MPRLHDAQIDVPDAVVRSLVNAQFPQWSGLALRPLASDGTINRVDLLGDDLVVRMPFIDWGAGDVEWDAHVLPLLARTLPTDVPMLVARGSPGPGMPWEWGVYELLHGRHPDPADPHDEDALAAGLVTAVQAMRAIPDVGRPTLSAFAPATDDARTRPRLDELNNAAATAAWDAALTTPAHSGKPVLVHGDLMPGNLFIQTEPTRLTAILDWAAAGMGDPALDLLPAWMCLTGRTRPAFLAALGADDHEVTRARAYAVRKIAWGLPYYAQTNPGFAATLRHALGEVEREVA